jgi:hypothetical protein
MQSNKGLLISPLEWTSWPTIFRQGEGLSKSEADCGTKSLGEEHRSRGEDNQVQGRVPCRYWRADDRWNGMELAVEILKWELSLNPRDSLWFGTLAYPVRPSMLLAVKVLATQVSREVIWKPPGFTWKGGFPNRFICLSFNLLTAACARTVRNVSKHITGAKVPSLL